MTNKIAAECCGSCEKYEYNNKLDLHVCYDQLVVSAYDSCSNKRTKNMYSPRNPIDNPLQKYKDMWEELKDHIDKVINNNDKDRFFCSILCAVELKMRGIEESHK